MPLNTEILRDGKVLKLQWDFRMLSCMMTAAMKEARPDVEYQEGCTFGDLPEPIYVNFEWLPIYYMDVPVITKGKQVLKQRHVFQIGENETVIFEPGDVLKAWRTHERG